MSTGNDENFHHLGLRLREERDRLGLSQEAAGGKVGRDRTTFRNWEGGKGSPNTEAMMALHKIGFDVLYLLTARRMPFGLSEPPEEYMTPGRQAAAEIAAMSISSVDAELVVALARRLSSK